MEVSYDGATISIRLEGDEAELIGHDAAMMAEWFTSALKALTSLRRGEWRAADWILTTRAGADGRNTVAWQGCYWALNDLIVRLGPRLTGIYEAVIREHWMCNGTMENLKLAMDLDARSTAQSRRYAVIDYPASNWETWARGPQVSRQRGGLPTS